MSEQRRQQQALSAGIALIAIWGASFTIQKLAYAELTPGGFLFLRSLLMSSCAVALLMWRGSPLWPKSLQPGDMGRLLVVTGIGQVIHIVLVTYGIHWSTPFSSALIMACGPVCTLLLLRLIRGVRLSRGQIVGVVLAFSGVLLVVSDKLAGADLRASGGDLMLLVAAIFFALYTILASPLIERYGGFEVQSWTTLMASPALLAISAPAAWVAPYATAPQAAWWALFWTAFISAFGGWLIWGWVNAVRGVARTAPLLYGIPPSAGVIAWFVAGEGFGGLKLAGAALALAGVAWTQVAARERTD